MLTQAIHPSYTREQETDILERLVETLLDCQTQLLEAGEEEWREILVQACRARGPLELSEI